MRAFAVLALLVLSGSPLVAGSVEVKVTGTGLDVKAIAAPLSDVLERISRQTGMKVVYEGSPTRAPVTASLERSTAAEVVMSLLEGQGISYALIMDPTGTRVETLMMVSNTGGSGGTATARAEQRRNPIPPRVEPPPEEPQPEPEEEPQPQEAPPGARPGEPVSPPGTPQNAVPTPFPTSPFAPSQTMVPFMQPVQPGLPLNGIQPQTGVPQPAPGQPEPAPGATPTPPPPEPRP